MTADAEARHRIAAMRETLLAEGADRARAATVIAARFRLTPLAGFRHAAGLTQAEVAARYNERWPGQHPKTFKQVSYWERWQGPDTGNTGSSAREPSLQDLMRLAALFGCLVDDLLPGRQQAVHCGGTLSSFLPAGETSGYAGRHGDGAVVTICVPYAEGTGIVQLSRRDFELLTVGTLAALLPGSLLAAGGPRPASLADYQQVLLAHQSAHHLLPPSAHITVLRRHLTAMTRHSQAAGRPLRRMQSQYAEHIGWLYRETGDLTACRHWAGRATRWARDGGDRSMAAYMMLRQASLALDTGDHHHAAALAAAAQNTPRIPRRLAAAAQIYQARSAAVTGQLAAADLDAAAGTITAAQADGDPVYLRFITPGFAGLQQATCFTSAGQPERAITILQREITTLPPARRRDLAVYLTRLSAAHAAAAEPDAAATAGLAALTEAQRTGSQHTLAELRRLGTGLARRWPAQPGVMQFREAIRAA